MGVTPSISTSHSQQGLSSNSVLKFMFLKGILEHFKLILCISNGFSTRYPLKTSYICTKNLQQLDTPSTSLILVCQPFLQFRIDFIAQKQFEMVIPKGKAIQLQRETRGSFFIGFRGLVRVPIDQALVTYPPCTLWCALDAQKILFPDSASLTRCVVHVQLCEFQSVCVFVLTPCSLFRIESGHL